MKILVTGGCGFIGSHLVRRLHSEGHDVRILGVHHDSVAGLPEGVEFFKGDIRDQQACRKALEGCEAVSHLAARISFDGGQESESWDVNVGGTFNMLCAALEEKVKTFHFMSTGLVLGNIPHPYRAAEDWKPNTPLSAYGAGKLLGETLCRDFGRAYGLPVVITRTFNVYGPGQSPDARGAMISKFIKLVTGNKPPVIYGDGNQAKDWIYISDLAGALHSAIVSRSARGETIHLCSGSGTSVRDLAERIISICGKKMSPVYKEMRYGDFERSCGDNSKAKRLLGWEPGTQLDEGLKQTIDFLKAAV